MDSHDQDSSLPPLIESKRINRGRWWIHLLVLALYPIVIGLASMLLPNRQDELLLPNTTSELLFGIGAELSLFGAVFGVAWLATRATREQLFLRWNGGFKPVLWGIAYSIGLRVGIALVVGLFAAVWALVGNVGPEAIEELRPRTEAVVDTSALLNNPLYLLINLTLVSFVMAGFREELWRAGIIAACVALSPSNIGGNARYYVAAIFAAVLFGFGHFPQGLGGVMLTTILGLGLGVIMVRHKSVWEAVLAHGFFDATTFAALALIARFYPDLIPGG